MQGEGPPHADVLRHLDDNLRLQARLALRVRVREVVAGQERQQLAELEPLPVVCNASPDSVKVTMLLLSEDELSAHRLGEFELLVLLAALRLGADQAYPVSIVDEIKKRTGRDVQRASVYVTLQRLEAKGLVS